MFPFPPHTGRFLSDEESLEYKYFRLRLAEVQRRSPAQESPEALRALLYARTAASIKRKLFRRKRKTGILHPLRPNKSRRVRRASTGTQTVKNRGKNPPDLAKGRDSEPNSSVCQQGPGLDGSQSVPGSEIPEGKTEHEGLETSAQLGTELGDCFPEGE